MAESTSLASDLLFSKILDVISERLLRVISHSDPCSVLTHIVCCHQEFFRFLTMR